MSALRSEGLSARRGVGDFSGPGDAGRGGEGAACCGSFSGSGLEAGGIAERFGSRVPDTLDFPALAFGMALAFGLGGALGFAVPFFVLLGVEGWLEAEVRFGKTAAVREGGGSGRAEPLSLAVEAASTFACGVLDLDLAVGSALGVDGRIGSLVSSLTSSALTSSPLRRRRLRPTILDMRFEGTGGGWGLKTGGKILYLEVGRFARSEWDNCQMCHFVW